MSFVSVGCVLCDACQAQAGPQQADRQPASRPPGPGHLGPGHSRQAARQGRRQPGKAQPGTRKKREVAESQSHMTGKSLMTSCLIWASSTVIHTSGKDTFFPNLPASPDELVDQDNDSVLGTDRKDRRLSSSPLAGSCSLALSATGLLRTERLARSPPSRNGEAPWVSFSCDQHVSRGTERARSTCYPVVSQSCLGYPPTPLGGTPSKNMSHSGAS